jgi:flagellar basal body rod protein FlgG
MQIGKALAVAANALQHETQRFSRSAHNVANVNTAGFDATQSHRSTSADSPANYGRDGAQLQASDAAETPFSNTDLAEERVTQLSSLRALQANIAMLRTADQMLGELVSRKA